MNTLFNIYLYIISFKLNPKIKTFFFILDANLFFKLFYVFYFVLLYL